MNKKTEPSESKSHDLFNAEYPNFRKAFKTLSHKSLKKKSAVKRNQEPVLLENSFDDDYSDFQKMTQTLSMDVNDKRFKEKHQQQVPSENDEVVVDEEWEEILIGNSLYTEQSVVESSQDSIHKPPSSTDDLKSVVADENVILEAKSSKKDEEESDEDNNLVLRIAEDFSTRKKLIIVGKVLYFYNNQFFQQLSEDDAQRLIFRLYKEVRRVNTFSAVKTITSLLMLTAKDKLDEFPLNEHIVVFTNGTLEIRSNRFRENSPEDYAVSGLGINYQPDNYEMPNTKRFLRTIADGDSDLYKLLLQVIGYILSNDMRAKSFFYLEGVGNAGKSRFCDLIASFFPTNGANKVARIALQDLGKQFSLGNLVHAKLNISEDLPDTPLSPTTVSRIKMLSDANRLEAEAKYVQAFSFRPQCKLLFASNHPLRLKEYDEAFANRVVYIPFLKAIPKEKQDKFILEKMQNELPALFNNAFKAYKELVQNHYVWAGSDRFTPNIICKSVSVIDKGYVLKQFVSCCCEFDENSITSIKDLQVAYNTFCYENAYHPIAGDRFSRELFPMLPDNIERMKIGNQKRGFKGIKLKDNLSL